MNSVHSSTVLIVEHNQDNLIYTTNALELFGCRCLSASEAIAGLSIAQQCQPDLILLDINLPIISGIELLNILRSDWLTRDISVIAMTALAMAKKRQQIITSGFDDCLFKFALIEDLQHVISPYVAQNTPTVAL